MTIPMPDADGKVRLWLIDKEKWAYRYAVDARELVGGGGASIAGPVVEVKKGKKSQTVCEEQVAALEGEGWKRVALPPAEPLDPEAGKAPNPGASDTPPTPVDFSSFDDAQLGQWLATAVPGMASDEIVAMSKAQLIEQLERMNFVPPAE